MSPTVKTSMEYVLIAVCLLVKGLFCLCYITTFLNPHSASLFFCFDRIAVRIVPERKLVIVGGIIVSGLQSQHFIETPLNIVYVMGDVDPTFKCAQDLNYTFRHLIAWYEFFTDPTQYKLIAIYTGVETPYTHTHARNGTNLRILRPNLSVAGKYACDGINIDGESELFPAELIVLGRNAVVVAFVMWHRSSSHG